MYGKALDNPKHTAKNCIFNTIFKCEQFFRIANLKLFICDVLRSISQNSTLKRAALFEPQTSTFINTGSRPENLQVCCGICPDYAAGYICIMLRGTPALRCGTHPHYVAGHTRIMLRGTPALCCGAHPHYAAEYTRITCYTIAFNVLL